MLKVPACCFVYFRVDNDIWYTRALSLRNLVPGYVCGRVFPAGVGPGPPSRDAAKWLPSLFSLSVETRRQYGWLRIVFPGARIFRDPIWGPSGYGGTREAGSTVAERLVVLLGAYVDHEQKRFPLSSVASGQLISEN